MFLKNVQIVNFRNFKNARFDFEQGTNMIIGENDSGKSNALTAIRILLDGDFIYNSKHLKESDFCHALGDWRGHWIIISATFGDMTEDDLDCETCSEIAVHSSDLAEDRDLLRACLRKDDTSCGTVALYIHPSRNIMKQLSEATTKKDFDIIKNSIKQSDYVFEYRAGMATNFTDPSVYTKIVGDVEQYQYTNSEEEDSTVLGTKLSSVLDLWNLISVCYIDAMRDVREQMAKRRNPLKRIFDTYSEELTEEEVSAVEEKARELNKTLSSIEHVKNMGKNINDKLKDIVGLVYSPNIEIGSSLQEDIESISRSLSLHLADEDNVGILGLGHLNVLYMALKMVEFEASRNHEVINIMLIEEPEAHVHVHIQKMLFGGLERDGNYTQIIMTTHSAHISEVSEVSRMNVLKIRDRCSIVMHPTKGLDTFGQNKLGLMKNQLSLTTCLERYLDVRRSILLFSKGVVLVEGDAEEILIPAMIQKAWGISLDELGIGLINIGSVAFEYVASLFDNMNV